MYPFVFGFLGAMTGLGLLGLGVVLGWLARERLRPHKTALNRKTEDLSQEQEAFRQLQNYSAQQAYGLLDHEEGGR